MTRPLYNRHDLLRVQAEAWHPAIEIAGVDHLPKVARLMIQDWVSEGYPVIVRRRSDGENPDTVAVGVPLPPWLGKIRFGVSLPDTAIVSWLEPVSARQAISSAPQVMQPLLDDIAALGKRLEVEPAIFGGLLWQHLTGLAYLHRDSDLDLLWPVRRGVRLIELLDELHHLDIAGPVRIDGEILLAGGKGVNWRELHAQYQHVGGTVLVKSMEKAELKCAQTLFA